MQESNVYNGKWRDIPFDACKDWYEGAIKHNIKRKAYVPAAIVTLLSPFFIPYTAAYMTLDKLILGSD